MTLNENEADRDDMKEVTRTLKAEVDNNAYKASEALAKKHRELLDKQNFFEKETN